MKALLNITTMRLQLTNTKPSIMLLTPLGIGSMSCVLLTLRALSVPLIRFMNLTQNSSVERLFSTLTVPRRLLVKMNVSMGSEIASDGVAMIRWR